MNMKISLQQFLGKQHSWSTCGQNLARYFKAAGHDVHLCSTNGYTCFPPDLIENIKCKKCTIDKERRIDVCDLDNDYDLQLSYTAMIHWGEYLRHGNKNKFAIWNYDGTVIPKGWAKFYQYTDRVLPSSMFSYDVFAKNGVPKDAMTMIPHGVSNEFFNREEKYTLNTDRKYKVLVNIAQMHTRKNIKGLLDAWGKAFTDKDDVVMIAKVNIKKPQQLFEVSWMKELQKMKKKYKYHAPIMIINDFLPFISDLYRSCNIGYSCSNVECFNLPCLESMVCGNVTIASNYGGNIDFMNESNSLLIDGKIGRAPQNFQYWTSSVHGECFFPDVNHTAQQLQRAVKEYDVLKEKFAPSIENIKKTYTWKNVVEKIKGLANV